MLNQDLTTRTLNVNEIPIFLDLQASVPEEKRKFVKPRTAEDLQTHMEAGMPIMGVYDGEKLVAAALLTFPGHEGATKFLDGYPLTQTTAVIQSVSSIQKGTMPTLMTFAKELAQEAGYNLLLAKVHEDNDCGKNAFSRQEFEIIETKPDPLGGGYTAHFMQALIAPVVPVLLAAEESPLPVQDPEAYQYLREGHPEESQPVYTGC